MCSHRAGFWVFADKTCKNTKEAQWQALFTFRYLTSSPGTSLAPVWISWQWWKNLCKCMSWKRQTSSIQQPQHLSAPTLPPALGNLLTYLQQWARSPANPMSLQWHFPSPAAISRAALCLFQHTHPLLSPWLPANLHTKHNISSSVKIILPWAPIPNQHWGNRNLWAAAHRNCLTTCITSSYCPSEADSPSHHSPSFSKVRFNYWVI